MATAFVSPPGYTVFQHPRPPVACSAAGVSDPYAAAGSGFSFQDLMRSATFGLLAQPPATSRHFNAYGSTNLEDDSSRSTSGHEAGAPSSETSEKTKLFPAVQPILNAGHGPSGQVVEEMSYPARELSDEAVIDYNGCDNDSGYSSSASSVYEVDSDDDFDIGMNSSFDVGCPADSAREIGNETANITGCHEGQGVDNAAAVMRRTKKGEKRPDCRGTEPRAIYKSKKTGCPALLRLLRTEDDGWFIVCHKSEHNHPLSESCGEKRQWYSHKKLDDSTKDMVRYLRENNVPFAKVRCIMGSLYGSMENVPISKRSLKREWPIEEHAMTFYTSATYNLFRKEIDKSTYYFAIETKKGEEFDVIHVKPSRRPQWGEAKYVVVIKNDGQYYDCQCGLYQHFGILCCHVLR
ncbi:hypothetical protein EJB05_32542, partial [Eragrostis curvula]